MARQMKDSGVEWIGEMPEEWCLIPNKRVMRKEKRICEQYGGEKVLSLTINGVIERDILNPKGKMPTTFDGYQHVYSGELILCLFDIDVTPCCVGRAYISGITSPAYSVFQLENDADLGYYFYYYKMVDNSKELLHLAKNLRHSFTEEQLGSLYVPKPNIIEQQKIANRLDAKCTEIDKVVEQTRATIEEYKKLKQAIITEAVTKGVRGPRPMKPSGGEWIGDIPEEWRVGRIKDFAQLQTGATPSTSCPHYFNGEIPWFTPGDFSESFEVTVSQRTLSKQAEDEKQAVILPPQTPLLVGIGASAGKVSFSQVKCSCNQQVTALIECSANPKLLTYILEAGRVYLRDTAAFTTLPIINNQTLGYFKIAVPTCVAEQQEIAAYLDAKCAEIDRIIQKKEQLIEELGSYKKSLIYEYVTGKKEVSHK